MGMQSFERERQIFGDWFRIFMMLGIAAFMAMNFGCNTRRDHDSVEIAPANQATRQQLGWDKREDQKREDDTYVESIDLQNLHAKMVALSQLTKREVIALKCMSFANNRPLLVKMGFGHVASLPEVCDREFGQNWRDQFTSPFVQEVSLDVDKLGPEVPAKHYQPVMAAPFGGVMRQVEMPASAEYKYYAGCISHAPLIEPIFGSAGVPAWVVYGLAYAESGCDEQAMSHFGGGSGYRGLWQLKPEQIGGNDPLNYPTVYKPVANRMAYYYRSLGDWRLVFLAWNIGLQEVKTCFTDQGWTSDRPTLQIEQHIKDHPEACTRQMAQYTKRDPMQLMLKKTQYMIAKMAVAPRVASEIRKAINWYDVRRSPEADLNRMCRQAGGSIVLNYNPPYCLMQ
ncbi:transglycosylase SLT domain-containing protein [Candidatus Nomurabacteria bacterium]|nr:transglycosylase SLT domain-containing protein [Candidatus Nomurabacteria bacterium]